MTELTPERRRRIRDQAEWDLIHSESRKYYVFDQRAHTTPDILLLLLDALEAAEARIAELDWHLNETDIE